MAQLRLALVLGYDWCVPGGVQNQVASLASALSRKGVAVVVVAPRRTAAAAAGPPVSGFELVAAGSGIEVPVNGSRAPVAPTPRAMARTVRALSALRPDVVHVHEPLVPGPPLASVLAGPRPIVATFHRAEADLVYRMEGLALGSLCLRRISALTAVSAEAASTASAVLGARAAGLVVVPNGVDLERFERARSGGTTSVATDSPLVVFVGRHEPRKGVGVLIDSLAYLPEELRVVIAGEGPDTESLVRRAADDERVRFAGRLSDEEVAKLIAAADVFVAPAVGGESFGVVLLEAMAAGTPVVAADIAGYRLAAAGAARLFRRGDPRDLARALTDVLEDSALRSRLIVAGIERARSCSIDVVAARYLELYYSTLSDVDRDQRRGRRQRLARWTGS